MRIGVTGYKGRLGSQLVNAGCEPIDYDVTSQKEFDWDGDVIINCAAKTDVDACANENYYLNAIKVNADGIRNLGDRFNRSIIHISTDYVFGGKRGAYSETSKFREDDLPTTRMSYGITKFAGEMLANDYDNIYIVRTTGLYGGKHSKEDFLSMVLKSFRESNDDLLIASDLNGNQTYIPHLVEALIQYADLKNKPKVIHIASKEVISRYEFALMIASVYDLDKSRIKLVKSKNVPGWIEDRPLKGGLKVRLAEKLGLPIYSILDGLKASKGAQL